MMTSSLSKLTYYLRNRKKRSKGKILEMSLRTDLMSVKVAKGRFKNLAVQNALKEKVK